MVVWSARALSDVAGIYAYLAGENEPAAGRVTDRLMEAGANLVRFPHLGRPSRLVGRRELVVDSYILVYRLRRDAVHIITVEHGARRK
jgi:plasmid stabilization system protein ParE